MSRAFPILILSILVSISAACTDQPAAPREPESPASGGMASVASPDTLAAPRLVELGGPGMDNLRAHLDSIDDLAGEQLEAARETHSELVRSLLAKVITDLSTLTTVSGELQAAVRGVREDWERVPTLGTEEFQSFLPGHLTRVQRLMELRRQRLAETHMG